MYYGTFSRIYPTMHQQRNTVYKSMTINKAQSINIIGGGLAGSEAAWQISQAGFPVILHEMRPSVKTGAHRTDGLAELVCSNSFRSDDGDYNAVGLLHREMRQLNSLIMRAADATKVPAGSALAVDRDAFSAFITETIGKQPQITVERGEIQTIPDDWDAVIIATGPLTSDALSGSITAITGDTGLAFFDAIAPIIYRESIDFDKAWFQSRYDKGDGNDYINCPMDKDTYYAFIENLISGEKVDFHQWETSTPYFEGCLPIEVMAERGPETLAYGPMKPVGLTNPHNPTVKPYAIAQLRQDNALATLYNMVGFQTKLTYGEQKRIFRQLPGLENAEFARLGGLHRNTFINGPELLDPVFRLKKQPKIRFAGQITGCEGYVESSATGLLAGLFAINDLTQQDQTLPPPTTAMGALLGHITGGANAETYQPMNVNFGLFPPSEAKNAKGRPVKGRERKKAMTERAQVDFKQWLKTKPYPGPTMA